MSGRADRRRTAAVLPEGLPASVRRPGPDDDGPVARGRWDEIASSLAEAQHGVVSRPQLLTAGLTDSAIKHRIRRSRLHPVQPGVYAVGHRVLSARGWWMAAVLGGGDGALLSHRAAAALWGLVPGSPRSDVLVLRTATRRAGVRAHRVRRIRVEDRCRHAGIPCTSIARTLLDLAATVDARVLDRAVRRTVDLRLYDARDIDRVLLRRQPGVVALRAAVAALQRDERAGLRTKSELERRFLELLRAHGFVLPRTNVVVATPWAEYEVDALWPAERLVIELDGWSTHHDREGFRRDHRRTTDLAAAGHRVVRLTWEQVVTRPEETVARLERLVPREAA